MTAYVSAKTESLGAVRKIAVMTRNDQTVYALLSVLLAVAILSFIAYWIGLPEWRTHFFAFTMMSLILVFTLYGFVQPWLVLPFMRRPLAMPPVEGARVGVFTTFVPSGESLEMLEYTVRALVAMRYPHDTWVLDEGNDPRVRALCERLGARHFSRKGRADLNTTDGWLKARTKYGNVNAWLRETGFDAYDFIVNFDPDHVPVPWFLERELGFFADPRVGFVQAAQVYYNQGSNLIGRGSAEETYGYYSSSLMASYGLNNPVAIGCHNTHRASALRMVGGFAPHDADDLLIALNYLANGWDGIYVPEVLAVGLTPTDWPSYLIQQRRWSRSVMDIKLRFLPKLWRYLPPRARWTALNQGLTYFIDGLMPIASTVLLTYMLVNGEAHIFTRLIGHELFALMMAILAIDVFRQKFFLDRREWGLHWRAGIVRFAKWPFILLGLYEAFTGKTRRYELTSKISRARPSMLYLLPHLITAAIVGFAWTYGWLHGIEPHWAAHFWAAIIMSVSLGVFLTGDRIAVPPFDAELLKAALQRINQSPERIQGDANQRNPAAIHVPPPIRNLQRMRAFLKGR